MRPEFDQRGWHGSFQLSLGLREGNNETVNLGGGLRLQHAVPFVELPEDDSGERSEDSGAGIDAAVDAGGDVEAPGDDETLGFRSPRRLLFLTVSGAFEEQDGEEAVNEGFTHLRWTRMWTRRWGTEFFGQVEFDEFRRLDRRALLGGGARWPLIETASQQLFLGTGLMAEFERLEPLAGGEEATDVDAVRSTSYVAFRRAPSDGRVSYLATLYFQPVVDEPEDFRLLGESEIAVALGARLSLGFVLVVKHDNDPPLGIEERDLQLTNRLRVRF